MFKETPKEENRAKSNLNRLKTVYDLRVSHLGPDPSTKSPASSQSSETFDINDSFVSDESMNDLLPTSVDEIKVGKNGKIGVL